MKDAAIYNRRPEKHWRAAAVDARRYPIPRGTHPKSADSFGHAGDLNTSLSSRLPGPERDSIGKNRAGLCHISPEHSIQFELSSSAPDI